jgi:hypothetical protein
MTERPWAPGPWTYYTESIDAYLKDANGRFAIGGEAHEGWIDSPEEDPDIALIQLAPEMAEAILAHVLGGQQAGSPKPSLLEIASKLAAIGGQR